MAVILNVTVDNKSYTVKSTEVELAADLLASLFQDVKRQDMGVPYHVVNRKICNFIRLLPQDSGECTITYAHGCNRAHVKALLDYLTKIEVTTHVKDKHTHEQTTTPFASALDKVLNLAYDEVVSRGIDDVTGMRRVVVGLIERVNENQTFETTRRYSANFNTVMPFEFSIDIPPYYTCESFDACDFSTLYKQRLTIEFFDKWDESDVTYTLEGLSVNDIMSEAIGHARRYIDPSFESISNEQIAKAIHSTGSTEKETATICLVNGDLVFTRSGHYSEFLPYIEPNEAQEELNYTLQYALKLNRATLYGPDGKSTPTSAISETRVGTRESLSQWIDELRTYSVVGSGRLECNGFPVDPTFTKTATYELSTENATFRASISICR